jgi:hypothetical protein
MMKLVLDSGQTVLINKVDFGRCGWRMPAPIRQPQAKPNPQ